MPAVLLIEDDVGVRNVICRLLTAHGYDVIAAASGEEALELESQHGIDLVVSDVMLPGLNGFQVVAEILHRSPHVRACFMSGHPDEAMASAAGVTSDVPVLKKPFPLANLLRLLSSTQV